MWPGSSSNVLSLGRRAGKPRQPTDLTVEQVLHTYRRLQRRCVAGLSWGCRRSVDQRSRSIPCMDRRPVDVKSMSEPQPYSIMSHVDGVSESPGPLICRWPVAGHDRCVCNPRAHQRSSRSGPALRLGLDRHGDSGQIGGRVLGDDGPWAATTLEPWAELRRPGRAGSSKHTSSSPRSDH